MWAAANVFEINLPSKLETDLGWFLNPFAWQFLMTFGVIAGDRIKKGTLSQSSLALALSTVIVILALIVKAPWCHIPGLNDTRLISADFLGQMSKNYLSPWRLVHVIALGYIVYSLIPRQAEWPRSDWSSLVVRCGQHSLEIFCLGTVLSLVGWTSGFFL